MHLLYNADTFIKTSRSNVNAILYPNQGSPNYDKTTNCCKGTKGESTRTCYFQNFSNLDRKFFYLFMSFVNDKHIMLSSSNTDVIA